MWLLQQLVSVSIHSAFFSGLSTGVINTWKRSFGTNLTRILEGSPDALSLLYLSKHRRAFKALTPIRQWTSALPDPPSDTRDSALFTPLLRHIKSSPDIKHCYIKRHSKEQPTWSPFYWVQQWLAELHETPLPALHCNNTTQHSTVHQRAQPTQHMTQCLQPATSAWHIPSDVLFMVRQDILGALKEVIT